MAVSYYSDPRLLFFRNDNYTIKFETLKSELLIFLEHHFDIDTKTIAYGNTSYISPDKDTQFMELYTRPVYYHFQLKNKNYFTIHFYDEESLTDDFKSTSIYTFYALSFYFVVGQDWVWIKNCRKVVKEFMIKQEFYDASLSFTFQGGLYSYFHQIGDPTAQQELAIETQHEILDTFSHSQQHYIEIQHKPFVDFELLLSYHPNKQQVERIQINDNQLNKWPNALFEYSQLKEITIYNNLIEKADERLGLLKNLHKLFLYNNPIKANKLEIEKLKNILAPNCSIYF